MKSCGRLFYGYDWGDDYTLGDLLDSGAFCNLWVWMPEEEDWIDELKEEKGTTC